MLDLQDEGKNNMTIKLKKKALQGAQAEPQEVCWKRVALTSPAAQQLLPAAAVQDFGLLQRLLRHAGNPT